MLMGAGGAEEVRGASGRPSRGRSWKVSGLCVVLRAFANHLTFISLISIPFSSVVFCRATTTTYLLFFRARSRPHPLFFNFVSRRRHLYIRQEL